MVYDNAQDHSVIMMPRMCVVLWCRNPNPKNVPSDAPEMIMLIAQDNAYMMMAARMLDRKNIVAWSSQLPCHGQTDFPHPLGSLARRWSFALGRILPRSGAVFLIELLFSPLPFLFEALDDIDGSPDMIFSGDSARPATPSLHMPEHGCWPGQ